MSNERELWKDAYVSMLPVPTFDISLFVQGNIYEHGRERMLCDNDSVKIQHDEDGVRIRYVVEALRQKLRDWLE